MSATEPRPRKPLTISELGRTVAELEASKASRDRKLIGIAMLYGMPVVIDDKLPDGEIRLALNGKTLAKMVNLETDPLPKGDPGKTLLSPIDLAPDWLRQGG